MLRLGVVGGSDEIWRDVGRRLRGVVLDPTAPESACDAVCLLRAEDGAVERLPSAGKHVLLADLTALTAERLIDWATLTRSGPHLAILNRERFQPSRQFIRQQLDANLGAPGLLRIHRMAGEVRPADRIADLDLALWLMGCAPEVVFVLKTDGSVQIHLGFPGGGMALINHAVGPALAAGYCSLSVIASTGAVYADDQSNRQLHFHGGKTNTIRASEDVLALTAMLQHFCDADRTSASDLSGWRKVLAVLDAVTNSLATDRAFAVEGS